MAGVRKRLPNNNDLLLGHFTALAVTTLLSWGPCAYSAELSPVSPCAGPQYRQFDFWVGDWDVMERDAPASIVAHARVEIILNGCVLHEVYEQMDGNKGESFSLYDSARHRWHQSWVSNNGQLLLRDGHFHDGVMTLEGSDIAPHTKVRKVRGAWQRVNEGVRETAVRSTDGGVTWVPWFDLIFREHQP